MLFKLIGIVSSVAGRYVQLGVTAVGFGAALCGVASSADAAPVIEYQVEGRIISIPSPLTPYVSPTDRFKIVGIVDPATPDLNLSSTHGAFELAWQQGTVQVGNLLTVSFGVNIQVPPSFPTNTANFSNDVSGRDLVLFQSELDPTPTLAGLLPYWLEMFVNAPASWFLTSDFPLTFQNSSLVGVPGGAGSDLMTMQFETNPNAYEYLLGVTESITARVLDLQVIDEPPAALVALGSALVLLAGIVRISNRVNRNRGSAHAEPSLLTPA